MKKHLLTSSCSGRGITRLRNNAFTLIELLAIIVILAIIAVITVPIILNIIENSRKGAATDSAYGFKDAVNKYYVTELSKPENQNLILSGEYTVSTGGVLDGNGIDEVPIPVSGDKPSSGKLRYANNVLNAGCLVIGDYKVTFGTDGKVTETLKGNCTGYEFPVLTSNVDPYSMASMCPGCQFSDDYSYDGTLNDVSLNDNYDNLGSTFFGYVINNNSIVQNYACGNIEGNAFCLRGEVDESDFHNPFYGNNSDILTHFFGNKCSGNQIGFGCSKEDEWYISNRLEDSTNNGLIDVTTNDDCSVYISCSEETGCGTSNNCS